MLKFLRHWRYVLLILATATFAFILTLKRNDRPTIDCVTINKNARTDRDDYKLLVVGESWASYGKLFPELPQALSDRMGGKPVQACSIGFSGRNTRLLYTELLEKLPKWKIYPELFGREPDKVILVIGVNDEIQHVGATAYVEYTKKLVDYFSDVDDVELISLPRVNERKFKSPNLFSAVKRAIFRCLHDDCEYQANEKYRVALWRDHPELQVIEFDNFIEKYEGNEYRFKDDGVHLTDDQLHKYGQFIGRSASLKYLPPKIN